MRANVGKKSDLFQRGKRNQKVSLSSCCRSTSIIPPNLSVIMAI